MLRRTEWIHQILLVFSGIQGSRSFSRVTFWRNPDLRCGLCDVPNQFELLANLQGQRSQPQGRRVLG
jgi:hypothetical protein